MAGDPDTAPDRVEDPDTAEEVPEEVRQDPEPDVTPDAEPDHDEEPASRQTGTRKGRDLRSLFLVLRHMELTRLMSGKTLRPLIKFYCRNLPAMYRRPDLKKYLVP